MDRLSKFKVGCVQAGAVFFDIDKTIDKAEGFIEQAAREGCKLLVFPETFIPGYPSGLGFGTVVGSRTEDGRDQYKRYWQNSVQVPGEQTDRLGEMAKKAKLFLVMGITERDETNKTLYCTLLYFSPTGELVGKHRKIKPTAAERVVWGEGNGSTLSTFDTPLGKIGGLICWENYMPHARMAMYNKGVEIYLAPTADSRDTWQSTMEHIACEGRCYVIGCNQYFTQDYYPEDLKATIPEDRGHTLSRGGSVIVSPLGKVLAGPLYDEEGLLTADIDLDEIIRSKMDFDVSGHYTRNDIFRFMIEDQPEIKKMDFEF
jgi:nitrilase